VLCGGRSIGKTELPHTLLCTGRTPYRTRKHAAAEILRGEGCGESAVTDHAPGIVRVYENAAIPYRPRTGSARVRTPLRQA